MSAIRMFNILVVMCLMSSFLFISGCSVKPLKDPEKIEKIPVESEENLPVVNLLFALEKQEYRIGTQIAIVYPKNCNVKFSSDVFGKNYTFYMSEGNATNVLYTAKALGGNIDGMTATGLMMTKTKVDINTPLLTGGNYLSCIKKAYLVKTTIFKGSQCNSIYKYNLWE
jgi:hypothetical protein